MSDKILNKINIINKQRGITFSEKEKQKDNRELISELDKRITDLLHRIEFTNLDERNCKKNVYEIAIIFKKEKSFKVFWKYIYSKNGIRKLHYKRKSFKKMIQNVSIFENLSQKMVKLFKY